MIEIQVCSTIVDQITSDGQLQRTNQIMASSIAMLEKVQSRIMPSRHAVYDLPHLFHTRIVVKSQRTRADARKDGMPRLAEAFRRRDDKGEFGVGRQVCRTDNVDLLARLARRRNGEAVRKDSFALDRTPV